MDEMITLTINEKPVTVKKGTILAAAVAEAGFSRFRSSATGQARGPLCGMGVCFECTVTVNGQPRCRSCQMLCEPGMKVEVEYEQSPA